LKSVAATRLLSFVVRLPLMLLSRRLRKGLICLN
jgi:hypothetical protein